MRLATVRTGEQVRVCLATSDGLLDVTAAAERRGVVSDWATASLRELIAGGTEASAFLRDLLESADPARDTFIAEADVVFLPPVLDPPRVFCIGRNYEEHAKEGNAEVPDFPMIFLKPATSLVGHDQNIEVPASTEKVDWEGEIAIFIGKGGRDIPRSHALDHVVGFAIANDVTARDWQRRTTQFDAGKMFDTFGPIGPYLVTADEVVDAGNLNVETRVNGEVMQSGNSGDMIFPIDELVSYLSQAVRLLPGDVILTGTPSGVGYARTPPIYLVDGDVVEVSVSGLGELRNRVVAMATITLGDPVGV